MHVHFATEVLCSVKLGEKCSRKSTAIPLCKIVAEKQFQCERKQPYFKKALLPTHLMVIGNIHLLHISTIGVLPAVLLSNLLPLHLLGAGDGITVVHLKRQTQQRLATHTRQAHTHIISTAFSLISCAPFCLLQRWCLRRNRRIRTAWFSVCSSPPLAETRVAMPTEHTHTAAETNDTHHAAESLSEYRQSTPTLP